MKIIRESPQARWGSGGGGERIKMETSVHTGGPRTAEGTRLQADVERGAPRSLGLRVPLAVLVTCQRLSLFGVRLPPQGVSLVLVCAPSRSFTGGKREERMLYFTVHPGAVVGSLSSQGAVPNSQPANVARDHDRDAGKELFLLPNAGQRRRLQEVPLEPGLIS